MLKAAEICGLAALIEGFHVKKSEVHGMAQRGGSVESHLRFGQAIYAPLIAPGQSDYLVCFHAEEEKRLHHYLRPGGLSFLPFLGEYATSGIDASFLNTYFLGILSAYLPMPEENWLTALTDTFTRAQEKNREVFLQGAERGRRHKTA